MMIVAITRRAEVDIPVLCVEDDEAEPLDEESADEEPELPDLEFDEE